MDYVSRLRKNPKAFRRLTGITIDKFDQLINFLRPRYVRWNKKRLSRSDRKRAIGAGRKFSLSLEDRFLLLLLYYRTYVTTAFLAFLFAIDESSVGRLFKPLEPLLANIFKIPEKQIDIEEDEILKIFFDGTEQPINRPQHGQKKWYSGKKKKHTIKHQVVVVRKRKKRGKGKHLRKVRIVAVSKSFHGSVHDKRIYEESKTYTPFGVEGFGDSGYQGTSLQIPTKKPKGGELTTRQKAGNYRHSRKRIVAEHGIGKMKIWRICRDQYRGKLKAHTLVFKNIAGFHNLMFA